MILYDTLWTILRVEEFGKTIWIHLNSWIGKEGWKQILPDIWQSIFYHSELNGMLVVYMDDFKLAGPTENMDQAWASIKRAVNIGDPEPYDTCFVCRVRFQPCFNGSRQTPWCIRIATWIQQSSSWCHSGIYPGPLHWHAHVAFTSKPFTTYNTHVCIYSIRVEISSTDWEALGPQPKPF